MSLNAYIHYMNVLADAWGTKDELTLSLAYDALRGEGQCPCDHCYYWRNN